MDTKTLIDEAAKKYPSRSALARSMNISVHRMNDWHSGIRPCPIEVQATLCEVAGMSEAEARAHVWRQVKALGKARSTQAGGAFTSILIAVAVLAGALGFSHVPVLKMRADVYYVNSHMRMLS